MSTEYTTGMVLGPVTRLLKAEAELEALKRSLFTHGGTLVPISSEGKKNLEADWSDPVQVRVEEGELVFRKLPQDDFERLAKKEQS